VDESSPATVLNVAPHSPKALESAPETPSEDTPKQAVDDNGAQDFNKDLEDEFADHGA